MNNERRGLVLGGGGLAAIAWETGYLTGLSAETIDVLDADVVVGTSAGATVAAQVTSGRPLMALYEDQLAPVSTEPRLPAEVGSLTDPVFEMLATAGSPTTRAEVGRLAVAQDRVPEEVRRAIIAARLPSSTWPQQTLRVTAVAADTGALVVFDRDAGVDLVDAVAASCAIPMIWPAVTIGGQRFVDGGIRSTTNKDVASDCDRVLVLEPFRMFESSDVHDLPGQQVLVITPDTASTAAFGDDTLDPTVRPGSARAGFRQGRRDAVSVREFWMSWQRV